MKPETARHLDLPAEVRKDNARELVARELESVQHYWALADAELVEILEDLHYCYAGGVWSPDDEAAAALAAEQQQGGAA